MASFGKKKNFADWLYTRPVIFMLCVLVVLMGVAVFSRFGVERDMYARRIAAEEQLSKVELRKAELEHEVQYLEGERGIEEEIRKHFDVAREGETVIILTGSATQAEAISPPNELPVRKWYQFWR